MNSASKSNESKNKKDEQLTDEEQYQLVFFSKIFFFFFNFLIFFFFLQDIGNAECYRILSDDLDIMQLLCKYYVELSRYREATCFIREGLDLTQLHYCTLRLLLNFCFIKLTLI